ncbi:hypothetical protein HY497_01040 [Candidatus Woesearchaeota archaeon]|nr:hypothetical protein [Candidatus Woesearchaeota archaeon]
MKRATIVIGIALLFIAACTSGTDRQIDVNYRQGYDGLKLELLPNYPPEEILEGGTYTIAVQISNKGAYDTTRGEISIYGFSKALNTLDRDVELLRVIQGRDIDMPSGEFYIEEFRGKNNFITGEEYMAKFWIQAEYYYQAMLNTDVCINPAMLKIEAEQGSCVVEEEMSFSGQGAPIAITEVKELVSSEGDNINAQFTLKIENMGDGELISPVIVDSVRIANRRLHCERREFEPYLVEQGKALLVCTFIEPNRGPYSTVLSASLYYTYRTREMGEILVKKIG